MNVIFKLSFSLSSSLCSDVWAESAGGCTGQWLIQREGSGTVSETDEFFSTQVGHAAHFGVCSFTLLSIREQYVCHYTVVIILDQNVQIELHLLGCMNMTIKKKCFYF